MSRKFLFPGNHAIATVFGGSGFIGRQIVRELAQQGWVVRVAVRRPSRANDLKLNGDVGQIVPVAVDINHLVAVRAAVEGARIVVNATGILYESAWDDFDKIHNRGPARIAEACRDFGVERFVHLSAIGADSDSDSTYARSKAAGEKAIHQLFPASTTLQPSVVFGPQDGFLNRFASMACLSPVLPLINEGKTRFQPVYVGDVADAILAVLSNQDTTGKTYQLGGPDILTFKQLMQLLLEQIKRKRYLMKVPGKLAFAMGRVCQIFPKPALTVDQVKLLSYDNIVDPQAASALDLGIQPTSLHTILPTYLKRFRPT